MIEIEKRIIAGLESDHELYSKKKEELKTEKNGEKNLLLEKMKTVDFEEVVTAFAKAMVELGAKYKKKADFYDTILAECLEDVEVEYPDAPDNVADGFEVVDLDSQETVE